MTSFERIVVLVPARNEARVIQRKLRNLAWVDWPKLAGREHLCVVIDDDSTDSTVELARELTGAFPHGVRLRVIESQIRGSQGESLEPGGKSAAVRRALSLLEDEGQAFDLVVLSDADVVLDRGALPALIEAFECEAKLGVACGAQSFVRELGDGPQPSAPSGEPPTGAAELYDRVTAVVRRFESRQGRLFSIHGQLCAWRAGQHLEPPTGLAADDLELGFRARARGFRVQLVPGARFFEEKVRGAGARTQAKRRALAYYQVMHDRSWPLGAGLADRLQWLLYRSLPPVAPYVFLGAFLGSLGLTAAWSGPGSALLLGLLWGGLLLVPPGRTLVKRLWIIAIARCTPLELSDRWDTLRSGTGVSEGT